MVTTNLKPYLFVAMVVIATSASFSFNGNIQSVRLHMMITASVWIRNGTENHQFLCVSQLNVHSVSSENCNQL